MPAPAALPEHRAVAPAIPEATRKQQRQLVERAIYQNEREQVERRRQLRGLLMLVLLVVVASIARAGVGRVFPAHWWRLW